MFCKSVSFFLACSVAVSAAVFTGCYRPSDEYLAKKGKLKQADDTRRVESAQAGDEAPSGTEGVDGITPPPTPVASGDGSSVAGATGESSEGSRRRLITDPPQSPEEAASTYRELFAKNDLKALPELDEELQRSPGSLEPMLRGAFAGVGNDTEKCEEILLYLTIRHDHLARELAQTASQLNPEIQSFAQ